MSGDAGDVDEDCDGSISCYADDDGDGYRVDTTLTSSDGDCDDAGDARGTTPAGDCDDTDASVHPDGTELCANGIDDDCTVTDSSSLGCSAAAEPDGDGLADCRDECPEHADKLAAGECGCGERGSAT